MSFSISPATKILSHKLFECVFFHSFNHFFFLDFLMFLSNIQFQIRIRSDRIVCATRRKIENARYCYTIFFFFHTMTTKYCCIENHNNSFLQFPMWLSFFFDKRQKKTFGNNNRECNIITECCSAFCLLLFLWIAHCYFERMIRRMDWSDTKLILETWAL